MFHQDFAVVGFIWDVPATSLERTERCRYDVATTSCCLVSQYWDTDNLYGWAMSQKLPVNNFESIKDASQFDKDFIKNYNGESDDGYFLEVDVQYLEMLLGLSNICHIYLKEWKLKKEKSL